MSKIDPLWDETLRHMLGATSNTPKSNHGYRNYFCAAVGNVDHQVLVAMTLAGLATAGSTVNKGTCQYFYATLYGCEMIGLSDAAILRVFEN